MAAVSSSSVSLVVQKSKLWTESSVPTRTKPPGVPLPPPELLLEHPVAPTAVATAMAAAHQPRDRLAECRRRLRSIMMPPRTCRVTRPTVWKSGSRRAHGARHTCLFWHLFAVTAEQGPSAWRIRPYQTGCQHSPCCIVYICLGK